MDLLLMDLLI